MQQGTPFDKAKVAAEASDTRISSFRNFEKVDFFSAIANKIAFNDVLRRQRP